MNKKINHVAAFQIRMHRKSKVSNNYVIIRFFFNNKIHSSSPVPLPEVKKNLKITYNNNISTQSPNWKETKVN